MTTQIGDIEENLVQNKHLLIGYCPQNNVLWGELTVIEHLKIFSKLKEVDSDRQEEEILYILNKLQMMDFAGRKVEELSGGQQRRVNLGIAFIGSPKLVVLDEPSKSLDPIKRRKFWDLTKGKFRVIEG